MNYKTQIGTTISQPISYSEIISNIASFDRLSSLIKLQNYSVLMKNQIGVRINIEIDYKISHKIHHQILLTRHALSFLAKEIVLNCSTSEKKLNDLEFINFINQYENLICDLSAEAKKQENDENSWLWVLRASNLQHYYCRLPSHIIARYFYLFSNISEYWIDFDDKVKTSINIDIIKIIKIGFLILAVVNQNSFFNKINVTNSDIYKRNKFTTEEMEIFLSLFSTSVATIKENHKTSTIDNDLLKKYEYNPLKRYPIVNSESENENEKTIIPSIGDYTYSFSEGIYYILLEKFDSDNKLKFFHAIASVFEKYIGTLLKYYNIDILSRGNIYPEQKYDTPEKKSADWIIVSDEYIYQIECKKRKLDLYSKAGVDMEDQGITSLLEDIAKQIDKLVKKENDIKINKIKSINYKSQNIITIVVYLDEMYSINNYAREAIKKSMKENGDNYYIFGCAEFEFLCQLCREKNCSLQQALTLINDVKIYNIDFLNEEAAKILLF